MNDEELQLVKFLHERRRGHGPAEAVAYRALLGEDAENRPPPPLDAHDLAQCLTLTQQSPAAAKAIEGMAKTDPHWHAVHRNWDTLHANLAHETGGTLFYPWAHGTSAQLKEIAVHIAGRNRPEDIDLPLLESQNAGTTSNTGS